VHRKQDFAGQNHSIVTTVDQTLFTANATYKVGIDGDINTIEYSTSSNEDLQCKQDITIPHGLEGYFHQNKVGYVIFARKGPVKVLVRCRNYIRPTEVGHGEDVAAFALVIDHGKSPENDEYAYLVVPAVDNVEQLEAHNTKFNIVRNDASAQVVQHHEIGLTQIVVFNSSHEISLPAVRESNPSTLRTSSPALVQIMEDRAGVMSIVCAEPSRQFDLSHLNITLKSDFFEVAPFVEGSYNISGVWDIENSNNFVRAFPGSSEKSAEVSIELIDSVHDDLTFRNASMMFSGMPIAFEIEKGLTTTAPPLVNTISPTMQPVAFPPLCDPWCCIASSKQTLRQMRGLSFARMQGCSGECECP